MLDNLYPAPGIVLIEPLPQDTTTVKLTSETKGRIGRGKVVACGKNWITKFGAEMEPPCKKGDIVYYLMYEHGYDESQIDNKSYIWAIFEDIRGVIKE